MLYCVYEPDGSLTCDQVEPGGLRTLADSMVDLAKRIGGEHIRGAQTAVLNPPKIEPCGHPTGRINRFLITQEGHRTLFTAIAGPGRFTDCLPSDTIAFRSGGDDPVPWPW